MFLIGPVYGFVLAFSGPSTRQKVWNGPDPGAPGNIAHHFSVLEHLRLLVALLVA